jgi:hypothetical protein
MKGLLRHRVTLANSPQNVEPFDEVFFVQLVAVLKELMEFLAFSVHLLKIIEGEKCLRAFGAALGLNTGGVTKAALVADFKDQLILFKAFCLSIFHFLLAGCRDRSELIGEY